MSWVAIGVAVVGTALKYTADTVQENKQKKATEQAAQQARIDANKRDIQARRAAVFAQTEGQGVGSQGQVNLQVDKNLGDGTIKDTKGLTL